jgi:para-nitrobenzyl esterase
MSFGAMAPQADGVAAFVVQGARQDEDCLTLNVWTPGTDTAKRPVFVWIHGGAFRQGGSNSLMYDGFALARRGDVVVVTINYRLGALGFLSHPRLIDEQSGVCGNWGLLDQIAALEWVRDNIDRFGGDAGNVTLFGESAGAMSVSVLLASVAQRGLFHRAVVQSGSPVAQSLDAAAEFAEQLAKQLDWAEPGALREAPVTTLLAAQQQLELATRAAVPMPFQPTIDGTLLRLAPDVSLHAGAAAGVPVIVGTNRDEWKLFAPFDRKGRALTDEDLRRRLERRMSASDARFVLDVYRQTRRANGEPDSAQEIWYAIESDRFFRLPAIRLAEDLRRHQPSVFAYLFTWQSPAMKGWLGACHGLEIPFVFGTFSDPQVRKFSGAGPEAEQLSHWMIDAWATFARTGNPSTAALGDWPSYDAQTRQTLTIGRTHRIESAPFEEQRTCLAAALADGSPARRATAQPAPC